MIILLFLKKNNKSLIDNFLNNNFMKYILPFNFLIPLASSNSEKKAIRLKNLLALVVTVLGMGVSWGQLLQWNTFANTGTETTEPSIFNNANISAANLTQGTITSASNSNRFGGTGWFNTGNTATAAGNTLSEAIAGNDYIQFIVTPNSGFSFTPTSFVFQWDKSGTGPKSLTLRSSADAFAADLGTISTAAALGTSNTITISGLTSLTTATTFRIYGYGATATSGSGGFDVGSNIVNVQLNGTTASTATPSIALSSPSQIAAGNVNQGATSHILSNFQAAVTVADASLNAMTVVTDGTYSTSSHVSNYKLMYNASSNTFGSAIQIGTTQPSVASAGTITFSSLNTTITNGNIGYFWITADIDANATAAQTVSIAANPTFTFASGSPTGSISASGAQTFVAVTPNIAISSNHPTASGINQNATNQVFGSIALAATTANASLNSVTITTGGTYQISDLVASSFKLYYTTSNVFSAATQLGSAQAIVASGNTITFSGLSQIINSGVTGYLWFTADVAYNAVNGRTLSTASTAFNNITFATGNKTGADPVVAGNDHTVTTVSPNVTISQVGPTVGNIINNINNQILYQLSLVTADNATDINSLTLTTAGTYVPSDLTANGFKLWYNTVNSLSGATQLGSGQGIVSTGNTITFSGLTQKLNIGTSFLLLTVDVASGATPGNNINITSTPFTNITLSAGNKLGDNPSTAGGVKTIRIDIAVGDVVINQFSPDYSGGSNEYVEIVNKTGNTIDLSTLKLSYQSSSGSSGTAGATLSGSLAPYSFWLLSPDTTITTGLTSNLTRDGSFTAGFAGASGQIAIQRVSDNTIIDAVGYGTLTGGTFSEGTPASTPLVDGGLRRVIDGADTGVNSTDYTTVTNANIYLRNSNSRLGIAGSTIGAGTFTDFVVTGNTSLSGAVNVTNRLSLIGGTLTTGDNLTLKSSSTGTANVPPITGAITGNVTVERYIPLGKRAFRLLSPAVTTTTFISGNWQEQTHITGGLGATGLGFDATETNNPSMFTYDNQAAQGVSGWTPIPNTNNTNLIAGVGYRVLIRGDKTPANITSASANDMNAAITLSATGTLKTGTVALSSSSTPSINSTTNTVTNGYSLVGNPYQSAVDWHLVTKTGIEDTYYAWAPNMGTGAARGNYVAYNVSTGNSGGGSVGQFIQPGQAFFVKNTGSSAGTLTFEEAHKATTSANVFRTANTPTLAVALYDPNELAIGAYPIDATKAVFSSDYSNELGLGDATKLEAAGENIAWFRNNTKLAIDAAAPVTTSDELAMKTMRLGANKNYTFKIQTTNFDTALTPYLVDNFLNTQTEITTSQAYLASFATTSNQASYSEDRFKIVFQTSALTTDDFVKNIKLYPNPAKAGGSFYVDGITEATVSVYNVVGQNIPVTVMSQGNAIQVTPSASLSKGVYLVSITSQGVTKQVKWIVE